MGYREESMKGGNALVGPSLARLHLPSAVPETLVIYEDVELLEVDGLGFTVASGMTASSSGSTCPSTALPSGPRATAGDSAYRAGSSRSSGFHSTAT